jgi:hypothetical protein
VRKDEQMSTRNIVWLVIVAAVGVVVGITVGPWWGVLAAVVTLAASELVERSARTKRNAAAGRDNTSPLSSMLASRRKR